MESFRMGDLPSQSTLEQLKSIIRRDLKLPADSPLTDDMPLLGGQMDFDSLDILLVITSAEKAFGVTLVAEPGQKPPFDDLTSLANFIDAKRTGSSTIHAPGDLSTTGSAQASPSTSPSTSTGSLLDRLPHQPPFRFVTRFTPIVPGHSGMGDWQLTGDEPFFAGHFPGRPILPGVLISESMAQVSGLVVAGHPGQAMALAHVDVRFLKPVLPPVTLVVSASLTRDLAGLKQFDVTARVEGHVVAQGSLTLAPLPASDPSHQDTRS